MFKRSAYFMMVGINDEAVFLSRFSGGQPWLTSPTPLVRAVADGDDHTAIKDAIDALGHGTERFAALRMDASVKRALTGRRLDEIA